MSDEEFLVLCCQHGDPLDKTQTILQLILVGKSFGFYYFSLHILSMTALNNNFILLGWQPLKTPVLAVHILNRLFLLIGSNIWPMISACKDKPSISDRFCRGLIIYLFAGLFSFSAFAAAFVQQGTFSLIP